MFESKYGKILTVGLIILILIVIGTLIFFTVDYIKSSNINDEASSIVDRFEGEVNKKPNEQENKVDTNTEIVDPDIKIENIIPNGVDNDNTNSSDIYHKGFLVVGTIEIPKINLKYPVLEGTSKDAIDVSVAVDSGPGLNKIGNTAIVGHNYRNGTFFSDLKNVSKGDKIYITDKTGEKVEYTVYNIYTTASEDSDYMDLDTQGKREVTLKTCTDDTKSRLIVCARAN